MAEAVRLVWSGEALQDIDEIAEYIHRDSPYYAQRVVEELLATAEGLREQPRMGRVVPELGQPDIRERFVYSYRLIYQIQAQEIHILSVIHGKRLLESLEQHFPSEES